MAPRLYVVPVVGVGTKTDPRVPKYFTGATSLLTSQEEWGAMDYGFEPWMCAGADLSTADDGAIAARPDVFAIPTNLDATLTNPQVNQATNKLEAINIPADWITNQLTWRQVLRKVLGMFAYLQRYGVVYSDATGSVAGLFTTGVTLATTYGSLPAVVESAMQTTMVSLGLATNLLLPASTLRVVLNGVGDQSSATSFFLGPVTV